MELNEKYKAYQSKVQGIEGLDTKSGAFREYHLATENIFDDIKSHKSSRDFKWLFLLLHTLVLIAVSIHIAIGRMWGIDILAILLLIAFWIYYRYTLKKSIEIQLEENEKIKNETPDNPDEKTILDNRIQYILNGIEVLEDRIKLIRNQYVVFFPVFTIIVIDIIRGPLSLVAFITTTVIAIILGGFFWVFYFKNDLVDLDNAMDELEVLQEKLKDG